MSFMSIPTPLPLPGTPIPPQSKGKGKHRLGTSPSAIPSRYSAQGEDREEKEEEEGEEEIVTGSVAKRRRVENHMTSDMTGEELCTNLLIECCARRAYDTEILLSPLHSHYDVLSSPSVLSVLFSSSFGTDNCRDHEGISK